MLIFFSLNIVVGLSSEFLPTFPNIGFLSRGYDVMKGNPHSIGTVDPGFRESVYDLTRYDQGKKTEDQRYIIPDHSEVEMCPACLLEWKSEIVAGAKSYTDSLEVEVSAEFSGWGAKFSASTDYKRVEEGSTAHKEVYTASKATCEVYCASLDVFDSPSLTVNFMKGVKDYLPQNYSAAKYKYFIDTFGTHVLSAVRMGGRFGQQSTFSSHNWTHMLQTGVNVKASASYSAWGASASVSTMTDKQRKDAEEYSKQSTSQSLYTVGALPPSDGKVETWVKDVVLEPMPLHYTLTSLDTVLTTSYFPDDKHISIKNKNLQKALKAYCEQLQRDGHVKSCKPPPPDPPINAPGGCMLCTNECGEDYPLEVGAISLDEHWPNWFFDKPAKCNGKYGVNDYSKGVRFCCKEQHSQQNKYAVTHNSAFIESETQQNYTTESGSETCRLCSSCGGKWAKETGALSMDQHWPNWAAHFQDECGSAYRQGDYSHGLHLCCQKKPACAFCETCGNAWPMEVGSMARDQEDWPNFFLDFGSKCSSSYGIHGYKDGIKLCCVSQNDN